MKTVAIIQARNGSSRLPQKCSHKILGVPMLEHIINRVKKASSLDQVVLATTELPIDDGLEKIAKDADVSCYRGSENDLVDRYYQAAKEHGAELIVRITADDPFKDPGIIDESVDFFKSKMPEIDILTNYLPATYPEGLDLDIFSFAALEKAWKEASKEYEREHLSPYMYENSKLFKHFNIEADNKTGKDYRWTVDYPEDMKMVEEVFKILYEDNPFFGWEEILELFHSNSKLNQINQGIARSEGLYKAKRESEKG